MVSFLLYENTFASFPLLVGGTLLMSERSVVYAPRAECLDKIQCCLEWPFTTFSSNYKDLKKVYEHSLMEELFYKDNLFF